MSRQSGDEYLKGRLMNGFDYQAQAWVVNGIYQRCGHPASMRTRRPCCNAYSVAWHPTRAAEEAK